ncbi:MAG: hypothetical protein HXY40_10330 [Chloroflexi bacterium]|nr:hypothetical protein [Chloroflexota bacterium]
MANAAGMLWYVNNEYRKRLAQAQTSCGLLRELLRQWWAESDSARATHYALDEITALTDEHRHWRSQHYYDPAQNGRMVQGERDITRALSHFHRMRLAHIPRLQNLRAIFDQIERPNPQITQLSSGDDLWERALLALDDLTQFQDYLEALRAS